MKSSNRVVLSLAVAAVLSACSAAPPRNEALETARVMIPEVEQSRVPVLRPWTLPMRVARWTQRTAW